MAIPTFIEDEDKDEINPMAWLRMINKPEFKPCLAVFYFQGESSN
jgi:hypothetical protein